MNVVRLRLALTAFLLTTSPGLSAPRELHAVPVPHAVLSRTIL
jgi:hypothetical protein